MDQPGQQHTILAELIKPAIDHVTRQPSDQTRDQMLQAGDFSGSRCGVDIVQRQHLEHQLTLVGRTAQVVECVQ